jgi:hypothetical protein
MKKTWILFLLFSPFIWAQDDDESVAFEGVIPEIGIDGFFSAGNTGGNLVGGLKLGFKGSSESQVIGGVSLRLFRTWSTGNITGFPTSFSIFGPGAWCHVRFQDVIYLGAEFEALKIPGNYASINATGTIQKWIPTLFLGGGYSKSWNDKIRLNIGIFYEVINNGFNPYRNSYLTRKKVGPNGQLGDFIPILYRLELMIPLIWPQTDVHLNGTI